MSGAWGIASTWNANTLAQRSLVAGPHFGIGSRSCLPLK